MNEVKIQRHILDLNEERGGYGWKLSNAFVSGVPDLLLFVPGFVPCVAEVKYIGIKERDFDVQVGLTPLQNQRLLWVEEQGDFGLVLIAVKWKGKDYVIGQHRRETSVASSRIGTERSTPRRKGQFNLEPIWRALKIPVPIKFHRTERALSGYHERDAD